MDKGLRKREEFEGVWEDHESVLEREMSKFCEKFWKGSVEDLGDEER